MIMGLNRIETTRLVRKKGGFEKLLQKKIGAVGGI